MAKTNKTKREVLEYLDRLDWNRRERNEASMPRIHDGAYLEHEDILRYPDLFEAYN